LQFKDIDKNEFAIDWETMSVATMAQKYGAHGRTIQYWAKQIGLPSRAAGIRTEAAIAFPANAGEEYNDFIRLTAEKCIIIGDVEIPDHDIEMLEMVVTTAKRLEIDTLIINGDFIAMDSLSKWARVNAFRLMLRDEVKLAEIALQAFMQTFKQIKYVTGNHERRLPKMIDGELSLKDILKDIPGLEFSEYPYLRLTSGETEILVCHQKEYSRVPLAAPLRTCSSRHINVWSGHCHRMAFGWDPSGKYWLVEGGHCRSEPHTLYKRMEITSHPVWNSGFGMIINGVPYLIDRNNFDFWLNRPLVQAENAPKKTKNTARPKKNRTKVA
jgi:predicted phosphodiesterase